MTVPAIAHSLHPHRQFLIAFSGGLDSTVLLHQMVCWRRQSPDVVLRAIHVHHGISPFADDWVTHCEHVCQQWQVPLSVKRVTLVDEGLGTEAHARQARYQAFREALRPGEVLVTAQHLDDQCETFLLALKRGSGPAGLSAMARVSPFADSVLIRPLLGESRHALSQWAECHQLRWIEDESNQDDAYDRNFLRLQVLPRLNARWPHFAQATARSAELCAEQEQLLDELLGDELGSLVDEHGALDLPPLQAKSPVFRAAILRRWLARHGAPMPSREMLARIWQEMALAREDASPCLRMGGFELRRYRSKLWWVTPLPPQTGNIFPWRDIRQTLSLPDGLGQLSLVPGGDVRLPLTDEPVSVRFKAAGTLHIVGRNGGRKLKKIWQELGVAAWHRDTTPLLFYGETLVAAAGYFITRDGQAEVGTGVTLVQERGNVG